MEKRTPHCKLSVVKALVEAGKVRSTFTAVAGGAALGLDFEGMLGVVKALMPRDFHKSRLHTPTTAFGKTCTAP